MAMEKRRSERVVDNLMAEIIAGGRSYAGVIMNFSDEGLYMVTATADTVVDISPSSEIKLKCRLPDGENLDMDCEIKWFQTRNSPHGVSFSMGMEIKDPPESYKEFLRSFHSEK